MRFDVPAQVPPLQLSGAVRHDLFLVVREAINNAVKHARAKIVRLGVRLEGPPFGEQPTLVITIEDDGQGFAVDAAGGDGTSTSGSGLANMRRRVEALGGRFTVASRPGLGSRIELAVPLETYPATVPGLRKGGRS